MFNVQRSQPAPESLAIEKLKVDGKYNKVDVIQRLASDFKNKCYLCESVAPISIAVEHLISHRERKHIKFDWDNLFYSCRHCNDLKSTIYDDILDCTREDVELCISYRVDIELVMHVSINNIRIDDRTKKTVELLDKIYNSDHTGIKSQECKNLRDALLNEMNAFTAILDKYKVDINNDYKTSVLCNLDRTSAFVAFKRWFIQDNSEKFPELLDYING
jgi:hypothetical protein